MRLRDIRVLMGSQLACFSLTPHSVSSDKHLNVPLRPRFLFVQDTAVYCLIFLFFSGPVRTEKSVLVHNTKKVYVCIKHKHVMCSGLYIYRCCRRQIGSVSNLIRTVLSLLCKNQWSQFEKTTKVLHVLSWDFMNSLLE